MSQSTFPHYIDPARRWLSPTEVAALCLVSLAQRKVLFEHVVADSDEVLSKRAEAVSAVDIFRKALPQVGPFEIYVLDKLEALAHPAQVLDTHMFADTPEIEAFMKRFELSMLRMRPPCEWNEAGGDIGHFQGSSSQLGFRSVPSVDDLQGLLASDDVDLKLVHYQYPGYEHFDAVCLAGHDIGLATTKIAEIRKALEESSLVAALVAGRVDEYRRHCLSVLGIEAETGSDMQDAAASKFHRHTGRLPFVFLAMYSV